MSQRLIARSPDLKRLRDEGYEIAVEAGHLVTRGVPYVAADRSVRRGTLVCPLDLSGDVTTTPSTHVIRFAGEHPCHRDGRKMTEIENATERVEVVPGLITDHQFSNKPASGYADFHQKVTTYVRIISAPAASIEEGATARTFPTIVPDEGDTSPFRYVDTSSSRSGTASVSAKLEGQRVAIVGVGGTGSYVLDFVAKCPVAEIHIFDRDIFSQHNAFRSPGAPPVEDLEGRPTKVAYLAAIYSRMHTGVVAHPERIDESNVALLGSMDFVFMCIDRPADKASIIAELESRRVPFVDAGMGVMIDEAASLGGVLRVTTSTPAMRGHVRAKGRIAIESDGGDADYTQNIQIAELNALNACLAVVKWKKLIGFYRDLRREHFSAYAIDGNHIINEDQS